jgi:hypothetical protein
MAHSQWCGNDCSECTKNCVLDNSIPCSPNCSDLVDDLPIGKHCINCDAIIERSDSK